MTRWTAHLPSGSSRVTGGQIRWSARPTILASAGLAAAIVVVAILRPGGDGPAQAAQGFVEATLGMDGIAMSELTCAAKQTDVQQAGGMITGLVAMTGMTDIKNSLKHVTFETIAQDNDRAQVHVSGTLTLAYLAFAQTQNIDSTFLMVNEDGWRYCGELGRSYLVGPSGGTG